MNPGEHVEGCTSPLHLVLVTSLLHFYSPDQTLWVEKFLGIGTGIAVLVLTWRIGCLVLSNPWMAGLIPLLIASRPEFALSMTNGLETGLATLLVTAGTAALLTAAHSGTGADLRSSAWIFLGAALARPELALTFPLLFLLTKLGGYRLRRGGTALACYCLPFLLFFGLRRLYYGAWVPNTYWAKHLPADVAFSKGLQYLQDFALFDHPLLSLAFYGVGLFRAAPAGRTRTDCLAGSDWAASALFDALRRRLDGGREVLCSHSSSLRRSSGGSPWTIFGGLPPMIRREPVSLGEFPPASLPPCSLPAWSPRWRAILSAARPAFLAWQECIRSPHCSAPMPRWKNGDAAITRGVWR